MSAKALYSALCAAALIGAYAGATRALREAPSPASGIGRFGPSAGAAAPVPGQPDRAAAAAVATTLRSLEPCKPMRSPGAEQPGACRHAAQTDAALMARLEELNRRGDAQARFELSMQLQRRQQGSGRRALDANEVAADSQLQRAVALLADAVEAGNLDAQSVRDGMGERARLLHTGR